MKFKLLKKFESPFGTVHSGVIKTAQEWADFFHIPTEDIRIKTDWFLPIDESKYIDLDFYSYSETKENYPNLIYTIQTDFPNFDKETISKIIGYVLGTCSWCHNQNNHCVCGRDD